MSISSKGGNPCKLVEFGRKRGTAPCLLYALGQSSHRTQSQGQRTDTCHLMGETLKNTWLLYFLSHLFSSETWSGHLPQAIAPASPVCAPVTTTTLPISESFWHASFWPPPSCVLRTQSRQLQSQMTTGTVFKGIVSQPLQYFWKHEGF